MYIEIKQSMSLGDIREGYTLRRYGKFKWSWCVWKEVGDVSTSTKYDYAMTKWGAILAAKAALRRFV